MPHRMQTTHRPTALHQVQTQLLLDADVSPQSFACSAAPLCLVTPVQLIDLFDAEMATSERLRAGEMLYARCTNPLDFWLCAMPTLPLLQVGVRVKGWGIDGEGCTQPSRAGQCVTEWCPSHGQCMLLHCLMCGYPLFE